MARKRPKSLKDTKKTNLKESFSALIYIPRFFKEIWNTDKKLFLISSLCRLVGAVLPVLILWLGKLIIDEIILQSKADIAELNQLWMYVAIEFGLILLSDLVNRAITLTDGLLGDSYSINTSIKIIKKTNQVDISSLEDSEFYDMLERARTQTTGRVALMSNVLGELQSLISIATLVAGLIYFEPYLLILLVLSIIPSFINEIWFSQKHYSLVRGWTAERRELDYLRFIGANDKTAKEIKLFGLTDFIVQRFKNLSLEYYELNKNLAIKRTSLGFLFNVLGALSYYGAYVFVIYRVVSGMISLGELTFLSGAFNRLTKNLQGFFSKFTRIAGSALYLKDYFNFIDISIKPRQEEDMQLPTRIHVGFEFRDVRFTYPQSEIEILKGLNFTIKAGEKIALVGQNGAGKTTIVKLLLRFYAPTAGEILLDGININRFKKSEYQQIFGAIFQDFFKYDFTLKENIAVGDIQEITNQNKIRSAAELSLANQVAEEFSRGYDQQLGKRFAKGQELSGGQWQKVALARAYMKDAQVMILDEPTSALDAKAESEVFERFIGLTKDKTSIIISHRFSTVRRAHKIIVLDDGAVLEMGRHEELLSNSSLYAELFELQAEGYQ